jgi:hypothetical protein
LQGLTIKYNRFFFNLAFIGALLPLLLGFFIIFFAAAPLFKYQSFESNENEALIVHTSNYQKGIPSHYPIGALDWGSNVFRIENKSNERIYTNFRIKLTNYWCEDLEIISQINGSDDNYFQLTKNLVNILEIPSTILSYESIFIDIKIKKSNAKCTMESELIYPLAINEWKFRAK